MHAFSIVDEDDFRESAIYLNPNCKIVCAKTIRNKIAGKFNEFKLKIIDYFKTCECKFSFTLDLWTSSNMVAYQGITVHYIDDEFKLRHFLIDFISYQTGHTGVELADTFVESLNAYGLTNKVMAYTMDNATSGDTFTDHLVNNGVLNNGTFTAEGFIRCFAHCLNLSV